MSIDSKAMYDLSLGLYVVGVEGEFGLGGCIVDAVMQITHNPTVVLLGSIQKNATCDAIRQSKKLSISVLPQNVDPFIIANFGFQSSRVAKKWDQVAYHLQDGLPILDCAVSSILLSVSDERDMGTHALYFCDVLEAQKLLDEKPLLYGHYREVLRNPTAEAFKTRIQNK